MRAASDTAKRQAAGSLKADPELVSRLRLVITRLARRLRQQANSGLSASRMSMLATVARHGPLPVGELAAAERVRPASATTMAGRLEEDGLVRRVPSDADRRVVMVEVTEAGQARLEEMRARRESWLATRLGRLGPDRAAEVERAVALLEFLLSDEP